MHWVRFGIVILIVAVLQASWVDTIAVTRFDIAPDLLLIVMVFFATRCETSEVVISSFMLGFLADIVAMGLTGPRTISFGVLGTGLAYMHGVIAVKKPSHEAVVILVSGIIAGTASPLLSRLAGQSPKSFGYGVLLGTSIYSAAIGPVLFWLLSRVMQIKDRHQGRG